MVLQNAGILPHHYMVLQDNVGLTLLVTTVWLLIMDFIFIHPTD